MKPVEKCPPEVLGREAERLAPLGLAVQQALGQPGLWLPCSAVPHMSPEYPLGARSQPAPNPCPRGADTYGVWGPQTLLRLGEGLCASQPLIIVLPELSRLS